MGNTVTLISLKQQAKARADMLNSNFVQDADLTDMVNASYAELYDLLTEKNEDYNLKSFAIVTSNSTNTYSLPTDFYKARGVDQVLSAAVGNTVSIKPFMFQERNNYLTSPIGVNNITLWYVPSITKLVNGSDTFDGVNGWEEYIVVDVARKMLQAEESDTSALISDKQALIKRIEDSAPNRDQGFPKRTLDINRPYLPYFMAGVPTLRYRIQDANIVFVSMLVDPVGAG